MGEVLSMVDPLSAEEIKIFKKTHGTGRAKKAAMVGGAVAGGIVIGVVAETFLPEYITPWRAKACPSERERALAEEYRNMRKASRKAVKADKALKEATKKERKGEYDKAERLINQATDLGTAADQEERDASESAGKRSSKIAAIRDIAKQKMETIRVMKENGTPHPAAAAAKGEKEEAPAA